jgi:hypothetical protein
VRSAKGVRFFKFVRILRVCGIVFVRAARVYWKRNVASKVSPDGGAGGDGAGGAGAGGGAGDAAARAANPLAKVPTLCVAINGGPRAKIEILQAVRRKWDIFVVRGTGGVADLIAIHWEIAKRKLEIEARGGGGGGKDTVKAAGDEDRLASAAGEDKAGEAPLVGDDDELDDDENELPEHILPPFDPVIDEIINYGKITILSLKASATGPFPRASERFVLFRP